LALVVILDQFSRNLCLVLECVSGSVIGERLKCSMNFSHVVYSNQYFSRKFEMKLKDFGFTAGEMESSRMDSLQVPREQLGVFL